MVSTSLLNFFPSWRVARTSPADEEQGQTGRVASEKPGRGQAEEGASATPSWWNWNGISGMFTKGAALPLTEDNAAQRVRVPSTASRWAVPKGNDMQTALENISRDHRFDNQIREDALKKNRPLLEKARLAAQQGNFEEARELIYLAAGYSKQYVENGYKEYGETYSFRTLITIILQLVPAIINACLASPNAQDNKGLYGPMLAVHILWPAIISGAGAGSLQGAVALADLHYRLKPNVASMLLQPTFSELKEQVAAVDDKLAGALNAFITPPPGVEREALPEENASLLQVVPEEVSAALDQYGNRSTLVAALIKGLFRQGLVKTATFCLSTGIGPLLYFSKTNKLWLYPAAQAVLGAAYQVGLYFGARVDDVDKANGYWDMIIRDGRVFDKPRDFFHTQYDVRKGQLVQNFTYDRKKLSQTIADKIGVPVDDWYKRLELEKTWHSDAFRTLKQCLNRNEQPSDAAWQALDAYETQLNPKHHPMNDAERTAYLDKMRAELATYVTLRANYFSGIAKVAAKDPHWFKNKMAKLKTLEEAITHVQAGNYHLVEGDKNRKMTWLAMQITTNQKLTWLEYLKGDGLRRPEVRSGLYTNGLGVRVGDPLEFISAWDQILWQSYQFIFGGPFGPQIANMIGNYLVSTLDEGSRFKMAAKVLGWSLPIATLVLNMIPAAGFVFSDHHAEMKDLPLWKKILLFLTSTQGSITSGIMVGLRLPLRELHRASGRFDRVGWSALGISPRLGIPRRFMTFFGTLVKPVPKGAFGVAIEGTAAFSLTRLATGLRRGLNVLERRAGVQLLPSGKGGESRRRPPPPSSNGAPPPPPSSNGAPPPPPSSNGAPPPPPSSNGAPPPSALLPPEDDDYDNVAFFDALETLAVEESTRPAPIVGGGASGTDPQSAGVGGAGITGIFPQGDVTAAGSSTMTHTLVGYAELPADTAYQRRAVLKTIVEDEEPESSARQGVAPDAHAAMGPNVAPQTLPDMYMSGALGVEGGEDATGTGRKQRRGTSGSNMAGIGPSRTLSGADRGSTFMGSGILAGENRGKELRLQTRFSSPDPNSPRRAALTGSGSTGTLVDPVTSLTSGQDADDTISVAGHTSKPHPSEADFGGGVTGSNMGAPEHEQSDKPGGKRRFLSRRRSPSTEETKSGWRSPMSTVLNVLAPPQRPAKGKQKDVSRTPLADGLRHVTHTAAWQAQENLPAQALPTPADVRPKVPLLSGLFERGGRKVAAAAASIGTGSARNSGSTHSNSAPDSTRDDVSQPASWSTRIREKWRKKPKEHSKVKKAEKAEGKTEEQWVRLRMRGQSAIQWSKWEEREKTLDKWLKQSWEEVKLEPEWRERTPDEWEKQWRQEVVKLGPEWEERESTLDKWNKQWWQEVAELGQPSSDWKIQDRSGSPIGATVTMVGARPSGVGWQSRSPSDRSESQYDGSVPSDTDDGRIDYETAVVARIVRNPAAEITSGGVVRPASSSLQTGIGNAGHESARLFERLAKPRSGSPATVRSLTDRQSAEPHRAPPLSPAAFVYATPRGSKFQVQPSMLPQRTSSRRK
jgi:hypothetical protein